MKRALLVVGLTLAAFLLVPMTSTASTIVVGQTIGVTWWYPSAGSSIFSQNVVVADPGVEIPSVGNGVGAIDIGNGFITLQNTTMGWSAATFNGFVFSDVNGTIPAFSSWTLQSIGGSVPPIAPVLSFNDNQLIVNFTPTGESNVASGTGQLYTFAFTTGESSVPEPGSTLLLLGLGLAGLKAYRKRQ
jgi:hypothetical protein